MFQISKLLFIHSPLYLCKIFTTQYVSLTSQSLAKSEDILAFTGYDNLKSLTQSIGTLTVTHDLLFNLFKKILIQQTACCIISDINPVNVKRGWR